MTATTTTAGPVAVVHVIRGEVDRGPHITHGRPDAPFTAPALDLDRLIWPRTGPGPAFDVPTAEIVDLLVETGRPSRRTARACSARPWTVSSASVHCPRK